MLAGGAPVDSLSERGRPDPFAIPRHADLSSRLGEARVMRYVASR